MKTKQILLPEQTVQRIKEISEETGLKQETVITTALIIGTMKIKNWLEEDK